MIFSTKNKEQIKQQGLTLNQVNKQLETFKQGVKPVRIIEAAKINNGIERIEVEEQKKLITYYEVHKDRMQIIKFVPASGAATRMFKFIHQFIKDYNPNKEPLKEFLLKTPYKNELITFFQNRKKFAFFKKWKTKSKKIYGSNKGLKKGKRWHLLAKTLLEKKGLNYGNLPKGLIPFHLYENKPVTAFYEQLYEACHYASVEKNVYLHFTISKKHVKKFKKEFKKIKEQLTRLTGLNYHLSYSFQQQKTDTITVDLNNNPISDKEGKLVFRPSGHGALLNNLNKLNADLIFIKNIDNVTTREHTPEIKQYKKLLAGKLLFLQNKIFKIIRRLETEATAETINEARALLHQELSIKNAPLAKDKLITLLNRPLRVCGMVKNTGAPGGGPFWVIDNDNTLSLQIVELSQIDTSDPNQKKIIEQATHFNPVDIVCSIKNYKGDKFNLSHFTNPDWKIITQKSLNGKPVKVLELPGLWNGATANWNTVFVEVPLSTFKPVKTVNDLLKPTHQTQQS